MEREWNGDAADISGQPSESNWMSFLSVRELPRDVQYMAPHFPTNEILRVQTDSLHRVPTTRFGSEWKVSSGVLQDDSRPIPEEFGTGRYTYTNLSKPLMPYHRVS
jgi:hypothetical protein